MTGPETKEAIAKITTERLLLNRQIEAKTAEIGKLMDQCPHEIRRPYRACGVETSMCIYCGHEVHVRDY